MLAKLIVLAGPDRRGKTTQAKMLVERMRSQGRKVAYVKVPYDDGITKPLIYRMLFDGRAKRWPNAFQFLNFINKLAFQLFVLPFMMLRNDAIVLDRWSLCSIVYGTCDGANETFCRAMQLCLIRPSIMFIFMGKAFSRSGPLDAYEADELLQKRVEKMYDEESWRVENVRIDAQLGKKAVHEIILTDVLQLLDR